MNLKKAKELRRRLSDLPDKKAYEAIKHRRMDGSVAIQVILAPACKRAIYQRMKRNLL